MRKLTTLAESLPVSGLSLVLLLASACHDPEAPLREFPSDLDVGTVFMLPLTVAEIGAIRWERFEVVEVEGNWVRARVVEGYLRKEGSYHWLNSSALESMYLPELQEP